MLCSAKFCLSFSRLTFMSRKLQEVELKLYTPDLSLVRSALEDAGAALKKPRVYERNFRYENADGTLARQGVVLRLRQDRQATLTYKAGARVEKGISTRFEAEAVVDDFDVMDAILRRLGYEVALIYEKYRTAYTLGAAEIALDEMPFGNFCEIEAESDVIEAVVMQLGLEKLPRMAASYTEIFADVKARLGLDFRDLTFDNFAGAAVSGWALGI